MTLSQNYDTKSIMRLKSYGIKSQDYDVSNHIYEMKI